ALPAVDARFLDTGPGFVDETGDGVLLHRQRRHPPGMDDIGSSDQEAHLGTNRHHQRLVDFQQVVLALGFAIVDLRAWRGQVAEELDVLPQILVVPLPLVAGDLDVQFGLGGVVDLDQRPGRRDRHYHQNRQWHDGPENLDGGAFVKVRGLLTGGAAVHDHRPEHGAEYQYADHHTDPENGHVQVEHGAADVGDTGRHVDRPLGVRRA